MHHIPWFNDDIHWFGTFFPVNSRGTRKRKDKQNSKTLPNSIFDQIRGEQKEQRGKSKKGTARTIPSPSHPKVSLWSKAHWAKHSQKTPFLLALVKPFPFRLFFDILPSTSFSRKSCLCHGKTFPQWIFPVTIEAPESSVGNERTIWNSLNSPSNGRVESFPIEFLSRTPLSACFCLRFCHPKEKHSPNSHQFIIFSIEPTPKIWRHLPTN